MEKKKTPQTCDAVLSEQPPHLFALICQHQQRRIAVDSKALVERRILGWIHSCNDENIICQSPWLLKVAEGRWRSLKVTTGACTSNTDAILGTWVVHYIENLHDSRPSGICDTSSTEASIALDFHVLYRLKTANVVRFPRAILLVRACESPDQIQLRLSICTPMYTQLWTGARTIWVRKKTYLILIFDIGLIENVVPEDIRWCCLAFLALLDCCLRVHISYGWMCIPANLVIPMCFCYISKRSRLPGWWISPYSHGTLAMALQWEHHGAKNLGAKGENLQKILLLHLTIHIESNI